MTHYKNPSNKNSLPSIIISDYDSNKINEIKIKYHKFDRLDKITINKMSFINNNIIFNEIDFNGENKILNSQEIEFENYILTGKIKPSNKKITIKRDGKEKSFIIYDGFTFKYNQNDEKISETKTNAKYILTIKDKIRDRESSTQRDILKSNVIKTYKQISGFENINSKDIYTIKRYIEFKSEMMFYYTFIDEFFFPITNQRNEKKRNDFYKFNIKQNEEIFISLIKHRINDDFKNPKGILFDYLNNEKVIINDFIKIQTILKDIRHSIAHFNFDFIKKLFNNEQTFDFEIELLDILFKQKEKKHYEAQTNYIENETIEIFDEKELLLKKLYSFYSQICQKKPAFNKLINSFIIQNGIENQELKDYISQKYNSKFDYFFDIHSSKEYKKVYNQHKELVSEKQLLENQNADGVIIKKLNDDINLLKNNMNEITKENSLKRLEIKLRLAFGFIFNEYKTFKEFNEKFIVDIKKGKYSTKNELLDNEKIKEYLTISHVEKDFFNYKFFDKKSRQNKTKTIFENLEKETFKDLVENDNLLKVIFLFQLFLPRELKSEFLGFILKIYHNIKNINSDTKQEEKELNELTISTALKLKILVKNIRQINLFNHSISNNTKYEPKNKRFYEEGNQWKKIYKNLHISHDYDVFDIHLIIPIIKHNINLYKLIGDFEIYLLLEYMKKNNNYKTLDKLIDCDELKHNGYYNFTTLLSKAINITPKDKNYECIKNLRNNTSHQDIKNIIHNFKNNKLLEQREKTVELISKENIRNILDFDPINDFTMKTIQLLKSLEISSDKSEKIENILKKEPLLPNNIYILYKLKGIELIKKELIKIIGLTKIEGKIQGKIAGNS